MRQGAQLIGRDAELARFVATDRNPRSSGVVLVGAAGTGKTALARAGANALASDGRAVVRVAATRAASTFPFGAMAALLPARSTTTVDQADLIRHTAAALTAAHPDGLVLVVDDAHLLDDASAILVQQLAIGAIGFVVLTVRAGAAVPDPITALWKDGVAERMEIGPLDAAASAALAADLLGGPVDPDAAATLHRATEGNPLFLQQLIVGATASAALDRSHGRWRLAAPLPLPADLVAAVEARVGHLTDEDRELLELIALGEPLAVGLVEGLAGADGEARLEALEAEGFVVAVPSADGLDLRLAHPLYGEVLRARVPRTFANRARLQLADAVVAAGPGDPDDVLRVARWRLDAGAALTSELASSAALRALARFDTDLAHRLATLAVATADGDPASLLLLATALARAGRSGEALAALDQLDATQPPPALDLRAQAAVLRFDVAAYLRGDYPAAFAVTLDDDGDPTRGAELAAHKGFLAVLAAWPDAADDLIEPYRATDLGARAGLWVALTEALIASARGRLADGWAAAERGAALLAQLEWDPSLPDPAVFSYVTAELLLVAGRTAEARAVADDAGRRARSEWSAQGVAWLRMTESRLEWLAGRQPAAVTAAAAAVAEFDRSGASGLVATALAELIAAHALGGEAADAQAAVARLDGLDASSFPARWGRAWALVAAGEISAGADAMAALAVRCQGRDAADEVVLLLDLVGLGRARAVAARAAELATTFEGDLAPAVARYAAASAASDPAALLASADELAGLGLTLPAAEAATAAVAAHIRAGDRARSQGAVQRAADLVAQLDGADTPGLLAAEVQATLTPREREVAGLAARGGASQDIADRLGLSRRTVEGSLQRTYVKLALAGRDELAAALGRPVG